DRRNRLADEAYDVACKHRLTNRHVIEPVQHRPDWLDGCNLRRGDDHGAFGYHDPDEAARSDRAPYEAHVSGCRQIAGEPAVSHNQRGILDAPDRAADPASTAIALAMRARAARAAQRHRSAQAREQTARICI